MEQNSKDNTGLSIREKIEGYSPVHHLFNKIGENIHPNQITAVRVPMAAGVLALQTVSPLASAAAAGVTDFIDWLDGAVARATKKTTMEGSRLDPLVDKIVNTAELLYLVYAMREEISSIAGAVFTLGALENMVLDVYSQGLRGNLYMQVREGVRSIFHPDTCTPDGIEHHHLRASVFGKIKKMLQSIAIIIALLDGNNDVALISSAVLLNVSFVMGYMGTQKRLSVAMKNKEER